MKLYISLLAASGNLFPCAHRKELSSLTPLTARPCPQRRARARWHQSSPQLKAVRMSNVLAPMLLALSFVWSPPPAALAAPGDLDATFAGTGTVRTGFGGGPSQAHAVAVQTDGKWVMAGLADEDLPSEFALVRFTTNNVLDTSFGQGGRVFTAVGSEAQGSASATAVQIQADGRIVAAGYAVFGASYSDFTLVRYNADGALDTTFGTNGTGIVYTDLGQKSQITAMIIQPDGRIVVVGFLGSPGVNTAGIALARYDTNGVLDATFASGGTIATPGSEYDALYGVTLQPDGKIVAAGQAVGAELAVYRFTTNGVADTSFGGTGHVFTGVPGSSYVQGRSVAYQTSAFINGTTYVVVAGSADLSLKAVETVVRYNLDGSLDTTFGSGGIVTNSITGTDFGESVTIQIQSLQRKIVVGGYGFDGTHYSFMATRYIGTGVADTTFGTNGTGSISLPVISTGSGGNAAAYGMASPQGEFLLAGYCGVYPHYEFTAVRFTSSGAPDTSFGSGGVLQTDVSDLVAGASAIAIQPNGAIVAAGNTDGNRIFALARYNPDGSLDTTFATNGKVTTVVGTNNDANIHAVQLQPDGKIVAAGTADGCFAVARYQANGLLDPSYGSAGTAITSLSGLYLAEGLAFQRDGKAVLAGYTSGSSLFALARYTTNGTLDSSFGSGGVVTTAISTGECQAHALGIQPDGKIVAAGVAVVGSSLEFGLARYNSNGALDNSFGSFGRVTTDFGSGNGALGTAMVIQPDGRIIVAGEALIPQISGGSTYFALARYATNGVLDTSFGNGGEVITQVGFDTANANAVALQPDGKIVAAGASKIGTNYQYAVVRYNPDGSLDSSYGTGGQVLISFGDPGSDGGTAVALDQIRRAVIAGNAGSLFGVARLQAEPFLKFTSIVHLDTGQALLQGLGLPVASHTLLAAPSLPPGGLSRLDAVTTDAGGFWQYQDTNTAGVNSRFYRLSYP